MIAVVNYGMGNLRSAQMALEHVGAGVEVTGDVAAIAAADGLVLPGVGAFPRAMEAIRRLGLDEAIAERHAAGVPLLGICLGMQLLFGSSTEMGGAEGLGLLEGEVSGLDSQGLKIPQIGWNEVRWRGGSPLADGLPERTAMYHVHSFAPRPADPADVIGTATYGSEFATAVGRGNVFGVQFHPEKSSAHGLALLANFVRLTARVAA
jgi:imidazole glycerol-phosphate synthase subunit HisH